MRKFPLVKFVLIFFTVPLWAQGRFELQPFVGIKTGSNFPVECAVFCNSNLNFLKINLDGSIVYGATVGVNFTDNFGMEFLGNRQPTVLVGKLSIGNSNRHVGVNIDQYQGNFVYTFLEKERKFRPFILAGVGGAKLAAGGEGDWRLSYGVGGGAKYFFNPHIGVRLTGRYTPTFLYATPDGAWCSWWGICYVTSNGHYLHQFDMTTGLVFRF